MMRSTLFRSLVLGACAALTLACSEGEGDGTETTTDDEPTADDESDDDDGSDDDESDDDDGSDDEETADDATDDESVPSDGEPGASRVLIPIADSPPTWGSEEGIINDEATIRVTEDEGNPPPSLEIEAPFGDYGQAVELKWEMTAQDLSGKVLSFDLLVHDGGGDPDCPAGLQFYVKTGDDFVWGEMGWTNMPGSGIWNTIEFDIDAAEVPADVADLYDPTQVREVGIRFNTGDCGGDPDGKALPLPATYYVDDIVMRDKNATPDEDEESGTQTVLIPVTEAPPTYSEDANIINDQATIGASDEEGNPPPSLRIDAPFSDYDQIVELKWELTSQDLSGKILSFDLLVQDGGGDPECPAGLQFYVKTGDDWVWGEMGWTNIPGAGIWNPITFDIDAAEVPADVADLFDPTQVREIGLRFNTGDCGGDPDGKAKPLPATFYIDDIELTTK